jgi:hypothetical protein
MFIWKFLLYLCDESTPEFRPIILDLSCIYSYNDYEDYYNDDDFQIFADESRNLFFGTFYSTLKWHL